VKTCIPVSWFEWVHFKETAMTDAEEKNSLVATFRKSFRDSVKKVGDGVGAQGETPKPK